MSKTKKVSEEANNCEPLFFSRTSEFLNVYLLKQAGRSAYTRKSYKSGLGSLYDYVKDVRHISPDHFTFSQCTYQFLLDYSQYLQNEMKLRESSVNSRIAAIRSYLEYAADCDASVISSYISARKIPLLTVPKVQQPIIAAKDLTAFLESPDTDTKIGCRDQFILILLFDSAVRVSELIGLTLRDIVKDGTRYTIIVHGKGRKERCVTLSEKASGHLKQYLRAYHKEDEDALTPLLYSSIHGNMSPMSTRNIERIMKKYGDIARKTNPGIPDKVTPHSMRRSRATIMYQDGIPIEQVAAVLGHKQVETTRSHYAMLSQEQMRKIVEKGSSKEPKEDSEWEGHEDEMKKKFGL